jgi:hypothetical protein
MGKLHLRLLLVLALMATAPWLHAALLSLGMNPYTVNPLAPGESAGFVPQTNWNNLPDPSGGYPLALHFQDGTPSGASVTGKVGQVLDNPTPDSGGDYRLMRSGLKMYGTGSEVSMTIANLPAALTTPGYDLYVYFDMSTNTGWVTYSVSAYDGLGALLASQFVTVDNAYRVFAGTFEACIGEDVVPLGDNQYDTGNYCLLEGLSASTVRVAMKTIAGSDATLRGSLNGVQIVERIVPEPATLAFLVFAGAALAVRQRRRQPGARS